ncbi:uncharacterized protein [Dysidea avara]
MSGCSWGRTILTGPVMVICGQNSCKNNYLEAVCGCSEAQPARLKVYKGLTPSNKEKPNVRTILFTDVKRVDHVKERHGRIIVIKMLEGSDHFSFYADSVVATTEWFRCCGLLFSLPFYVIPKVPEEKLVPQSLIDEYDDPQKFGATCIWVVHILKEGIAVDNTTLTGVHIITLRSSDATFNVHDLHSGKLLLSWNKSAIRRSGCIESLVFVEAGRRCSGGPGLLWMYHPVPLIPKLRQCLHDFVYFGPEGISQPQISAHISCDSAMSKSYHESCSGFDSLQRSDEGQSMNLSAPQMKSWLLTYNPSLHAAKDTPCSSQGSADSSGYSSDTSLCDPHGELSTAKKMFHLQGSYKLLSCHDKKKKGSCDEGSVVMKTSLTYPPYKPNNYENVSLKDPLHTPPLPPRSVKKTPYYENQTEVISKKINSKHSANPSPTSPKDCSTQTQSTCNPVSPTVEELRRSSSSSDSSPVPSKHQQEKKAFLKCSSIVVDNLSIPAIIPLLMEQELVNENDVDILISQHKTKLEKTMHLMCELPRKGEGFFEKFILCLCKSKTGTGHDFILKSLTTALNEVKGPQPEENAKIPVQVSDI